MSYKIVSLNTWGGQSFQDLIDFVRAHQDTDVFCFQEVFHTNSDKKESNGARANLYQELQAILPNHTALPAFTEEGFDYKGPVDFHITWGLLTFVRNSTKILSQKNQLIFEYEEHAEVNYGKNPRKAHFINIHKENHSPLTVINFHGIWKKGYGKTDSPERITQSQNLLSLIEKETSPVVLIGDFNLTPHSESLALLKKNLRDLISEHKITNTRSTIYSKPERYADYALISPELEVEHFEVPQHITASDHLPLILKIK